MKIIKRSIVAEQVDIPHDVEIYLEPDDQISIQSEDGSWGWLSGATGFRIWKKETK
jgi:hypothetical protein